VNFKKNIITVIGFLAALSLMGMIWGLFLGVVSAQPLMIIGDAVIFALTALVCFSDMPKGKE
jgi:hypothetical protein